MDYPMLRVYEAGCCTVVTLNEDETENLTALLPGQLDKARALLPDDLYAQVVALWTDEVVRVWRDSLKEVGINGEL